MVIYVLGAILFVGIFTWAASSFVGAYAGMLTPESNYGIFFATNILVLIAVVAVFYFAVEYIELVIAMEGF